MSPTLFEKLSLILKMHEARIKDAQAEQSTEMVIIKEEYFRRLAIDEIGQAVASMFRC